MLEGATSAICHDDTYKPKKGPKDVEIQSSGRSNNKLTGADYPEMTQK